MATKDDLLKDLEIKMDAINLRYEAAFQEVKAEPEDFFNANYTSYRSELAKTATDTLHNLIMSGLGNDEDFVLSVQKLNISSVYKLMLSLKKIDDNRKA
ncbi:hypothetical protein LRS05_01705 [Flavobacterium sp. J372]|uniref:hypothetical protein n=1 Tax=Flavobacterium sp. J372 TaxID=2898436 RepID=UPI0021510FC2|nr:hypothetical protein [Flavobacterium sp. J372]MCR5860936.1 hypothetical protein [Flavobacterium sp. J372]